MAAWTLEEAQTKLQQWLDADSSVAKQKSVTIGDRTITHENASEIRKNISFWRNEVELIERAALGKSPFQNIRTRFV